MGLTSTTPLVLTSKVHGFFPGLAAGLALGVLLYLGAASLSLGKPLVETRGFSDMFARKVGIARNSDEPKILFVGGSSVDLGISAEIATAELNRTAVNFGLISPLGPEYILSKTKEVAVKGDFIVLALEYYCFDWTGSSRLWVDPLFVTYVVAEDPKYLLNLPRWDQLHILARVTPRHIATALLRRPPSSSSSIPMMNSFGDRTDNTPEARPWLAASSMKPIDQLVSGFSGIQRGFSVVSEFLEWARLNGVTVTATFPNVCRNPDYRPEVLAQVEDRIRGFYESLDVPVVGTLTGAMVAEEDCFDGPLHLLRDAVERRTRRLTKEIAEQFPSEFPRP